MKWYEMSYNKPYHSLTQQQRLRYEILNDEEINYNDNIDIEFCYLSGVTEEDWNLV